MHAYDVIFVGLACDLVGAILLAKGFITKNARDMNFESMAIAGRNYHLIRSALLQRAEALIGATMLCVGFILQILGNLHGGISAVDPGYVNTTPRALAVVLAAWVIGWVALRVGHKVAKVQFYRGMFRTGMSMETLPRSSDDPTWLGRLSTLFDVPRKRDESEDLFFGRLQARYDHLRNVYGPRAS